MPGPSTWLPRAREALRTYDPLSLLLLAIARGSATAGIPLRVHTYLLVAQPVRELPPLARRSRHFATRLVGPGDPALASIPRPPAVIASRFAQNACCIGLFAENCLVGCAWLCLDGYDEDEVRCRFEPRPAERCAWDFDVWIAEEHRIGFAFASLWSSVNAWLAEQGVEWTMSRISTLNPASLRAHRRLGARPVGRAIYLGLGRLQLMASTLRPWLHASTSERRVPRIEVHAPPAAEPRSNAGFDETT